MDLVKIVTFAPVSVADQVREVIGNAGAGKIGNYDFCSISTRVIGRYRPLSGASPVIGQTGQIETIEEEKIEVVCPRELVKTVITAVKAVHPYEEVPFDIFPLLSEDSI